MTTPPPGDRAPRPGRVPPPPGRPGPQGHPGPQGRRDIAPPPPRFRPQPTPQPTLTRPRELGDDPATTAPRRVNWPGWILGGLAGLAAIVLLVVMLVNLGTPATPAAPSVTPQAQATGEATSTRPPANPQAVGPGAVIPMSVDAKFDPSITLVAASPGDGWAANFDNTRQPEEVRLRDSQNRLLTVLQTTMDSKAYTDDDLTRSYLQEARQSFTPLPDVAGEPVPFVLHGQGGYELEMLAQKLEWGKGDVAYVIVRLMPQSNAKLEINVIGREGEFENPGSSLRRKLDEVTFTVP